MTSHIINISNRLSCYGAVMIRFFAKSYSFRDCYKFFTFIIPLTLMGINPVHAQISGAPTLTDQPTQLQFYTTLGTYQRLPGSGNSLWNGGSLTYPAETTPGNIPQTHRTAAAKIETPDVTCTTGNAIIKASVRVTNIGPNAGQQSSGALELVSTTRVTPTPVSGENNGLNNTPVNVPITLQGTWTVPASSLQLGNYSIVVQLETAQELTRKSWTAEQLQISYTYTSPACSPKLSITKVGDPPIDSNGNGLADVGEIIKYTFTVQNTGVGKLTNVTIADPMLVVAGIAVSPAPQTLAEGSAPVTFTANYPITQPDIDGKIVDNTAQAESILPNGDPFNSASVTENVTLATTSGLTIIKEGNPQTNGTVIFTFKVTNTGTTTLNNVSITDAMLTAAGVPITPPSQTLAPGPTPITFTSDPYTPTPQESLAGSIANSATASGTPVTGGPVISPPHAITTPLETPPKFTLTKEGKLNDLNGNGFLDSDESVTFTFTVHNTGGQPLTDVTINDAMLVAAGVPIIPASQSLPVGNVPVIFTATYSPSQADINAGSIINEATASANPPSGPPINSDGPPAQATVPIPAMSGLTIKKTGFLNDLNNNGFVNLGETIQYTFEVINTGVVTLEGVTINDPLLQNAGVSVTPAGPQTLDPGPNPLIFTATYEPKQPDIDAGEIVNQATATFTPPPGFPAGVPAESPPSSVTFEVEPASLLMEKSGAYEDTDGDGFASIGDTLSYTFKITNDGPQTVFDVWPIDNGPTFNGISAGGTLSRFEPGPVTLASGDSEEFTATYKLTKVDLDNAGGLLDAIANSALAGGRTRTKEVISASPSEARFSMPIAEARDLNVTKVADISTTRRGEQLPFTIIASKSGAGLVSNFNIVDTIPPGFRFVAGSATINGVNVTPEIAGREISFSNVSMSGGSAEIKLTLLALSTAGPGEHVNLAHAEDSSGDKISNDGSATFTIMVEPTFDCGDIIGKVFNDRNRNGYQDNHEAGLPGARVTSVDGMLITTDQYGRFSVACADLPDGRVGSSYIMKLDPRSLPSGYRIISENPRVVRMTAGKASQINFAASLTRVVRLDLDASAFLPGTSELSPIWQKSVTSLLATLDTEPSILSVIYRDTVNRDKQLGHQRLKQIRKILAQKWKETANRYRLEIETRLFIGNAIASTVE